MRATSIDVQLSKAITVTDQATSENIVSIYERKRAGDILVGVEYINAAGDVIKEGTYEIRGDKYELLMSANPPFAPNKLRNEYREEDIWYVIDQIRAET